MDVAILRSIYTASSADFDRVTDHVQRRLKETQSAAAGLSGATSQVANEARKIESALTSRGPVRFLGIDVAGEKRAAGEAVAIAKTASGQIQQTAAQVERENLRNFSARIKRIDEGERVRIKAETGAARAAQSTAAEVERINLRNFTARIKQIDSQQQAEIRAAKSTASAVASSLQGAGTQKFDSTAFWARQGAAAASAAKTVETETKRAAQIYGSTWTLADLSRERAAQRLTAVEEQLHTRRVTAATRATSTVIRDTKTGATLTQAELAKIISGGSKVVEAEAKKVGHATGSILGDLRKLFLQNNFLFRQIGQRVAGDLGFIAVGTGKLALNFGDLALKSGAATTGLAGLTSGATGLLGVLGPVGIGVGVVVAGVVALTAASVAAGAGLFLVAKSVADTEQRFTDLNRQTGLNVGNLQALDIAAQQSGTKLDRLVNSVGQLQRKLIDASEGGTSRFSVGLKKLGIDLDDPNRALNQLIDLLGKLPPGTVRTGAAMQIFGRGGREVVGVIDQIAESVGTADGALERFKKQLQDAGVHIDSDGIETAGKFHDQLILLEAQFRSIKRVIGEDALPTVLAAATKFSDWIARNRVEISNWARDIAHVAESLVSLGVALGKLIALAAMPIVITVRVIPTISRIVDEADRSGPIASIAREVGRRFGVQGQSPEPEQTFARRTFTQDKQERQAADDITKKIRDAFAPAGRKGGGGRGQDPVEIARRLADIALRETVKGLESEHEALRRSLDLNFIARDKYTQDAVNLEVRRRQVTIDGLKVELAEAERIRKPGQRAIKVAEINARIKEEERRSAKEVTQITDDAAAEQLRIGQSLAQSHLRVVEAQTDKLKARARDYADFREITEREAAQIEMEQTLRVFTVRQRMLEDEKRATVDGSEKQIEAIGKLNELEAERAAFIEESQRKIEAARRRDAEHVVRFAAEIRDAFERAADVRLEAGEMNLEPLRNSILTRHQLWDAELQFEITREEQRHDMVMDGFRDEAALERIRIKDRLELAQKLAGIRAQEQAEEELHQARLRQLATQAAQQRREELLQVADDLASIASDIFDSIGKSSSEFWRSLTDTATNFAKQIRDELLRGLAEIAITGQAQGAEGLVGAILNPLLRAVGPDAAVTDNTKATQDNTAAVNALTRSMGGTPAIPANATSGLSGVLQFIPGLFGGGRASGGPVEAGKVYRVHENEVFFRPDLNGQIVNLNNAQGLLGGQRDEVRLNVAVGQDAVDDLIESHMRTSKGKRAMFLRAKANRKVGKLLFA